MAAIRISTLRGSGGSSGEGGANAISLVGPSIVLPGTTNTYTITNYDDFSEYSVVTSIGTISMDGETVTLEIPPGSEGSTVGVGITRNGSTRVFQLGLGELSIATPSIVSPQEGATGVPSSTTLQGTPFATAPVGMGVHQSSEWQLARDVGFTDIVVSEIVTSGNMTRYTTEGLPRGTKLYARVRYTSDIGTSSWSTPVSFTTTVMLINKPIVSIVGTDFDVKETPTFNSSVFSATPAGSDTHVASTWVLRKQGDESVVWQVQASTSNRVSVTIPKGVLEESEAYTMEVQHIGGFGTSVFSDKLTFVTAQSFVPDEPGTPYEGGYYAGRIMVDGVEYALIVAPKTQGGESDSLSWRNSYVVTPNTVSANDGVANTNAMIQTGLRYHPAAAFCVGLNINGYDDWYLPSRLELEILYRAFKPTPIANRTDVGANPSSVPPTSNYTSNNPAQTSVAEFRFGGEEAFSPVSYWSSTQQPEWYALMQNFSDGRWSRELKPTSLRVRAVRRVAV